VVCALREDGYRINDADPASAFRLDYDSIAAAEGLVAFLSEKISAGVQTEIGIAVALKKRVIIAQKKGTKVEYYNNALERAGAAILTSYDSNEINSALLTKNS